MERRDLLAADILENISNIRTTRSNCVSMLTLTQITDVLNNSRIRSYVSKRYGDSIFFSRQKVLVDGSDKKKMCTKSVFEI